MALPARFSLLHSDLNDFLDQGSLRFPFSHRRSDPWATARFAVDSPLEGDGFEPSVPRQKDNAFRDSSFPTCARATAAFETLAEFEHALRRFWPVMAVTAIGKGRCRRGRQQRRGVARDTRRLLISKSLQIPSRTTRSSFRS